MGGARSGDLRCAAFARLISGNPSGSQSLKDVWLVSRDIFGNYCDRMARNSWMRQWVGLNTGLILVSVTAFAAPPPNDDYVNRIPVEGEDVKLQALMEGSTLERMLDPESGQLISEWTLNDYHFRCTGSPTSLERGSVWWTWTAPRSGTVVIIPESVPSLSGGLASPPGLACFLPADLNDPGLVFRLGRNEYEVDSTQWSSFVPRYPFAAFHAVQGLHYVLHVSGCAQGSYSFRLLMPRGPHVSEQPLDKSLVVGESSFLHVTATGVPLTASFYFQPLRYQWLRDGIPIDGEIYSTLPLLSMTTNRSGAYQVVVSDLEGMVTSAVARVVVNLKEAPPQLQIQPSANGSGLPSGIATWTLRGEVGRYYVVESSTNLVHWQWQSIDALSPLDDEPLTVTMTVDPEKRPAHVRVRQEPFEFRVAMGLKSMFLRARRVQPLDERRSVALWALQYAKEDWARDPRHRRLLTDYPDEVDVALRISPVLDPVLFGGDNECHANVIVGVPGQAPIWPCVSSDPTLLDPEAYDMGNPRWVWNPAR